MRTRPESLDFVERAPLVVSARRHLTHPAARVFDALADTPRWTAWWPGMTLAERTSSPPDGVGSTRRVRVSGIEIAERFIAWDPGRLWSFTFLAVNLPFARAAVERVDLTPTGDGTDLTYRLAFEPPRSVGPLVRLVRGRFEQGIAAGVGGLARYLDADRVT